MKIIKYIYNSIIPPSDKILLSVILILSCWVLFVVGSAIYKQCNSPKEPVCVKTEYLDCLIKWKKEYPELNEEIILAAEDNVIESYEFFRIAGKKMDIIEKEKIKILKENKPNEIINSR